VTHPRKTIHIIGSGVVGTATGYAFESLGHDVRYVDVIEERVEELTSEGKRASMTLDLSDSLESYIFVCVPTPSSQSGYNLSHLRVALAAIGGELKEAKGFHVVVTRSTVAPLTWARVVTPELEEASGRSVGDGYAIASAPEFLRQVSALEDARSPRVTVVAALDEQVRASVAAIFAPLGGVVKTFDDPTIAETIKLANNCFNAAKISFTNEIWSICAHLGISQLEVAEVVAQSAEGSYNPTYGITGGYAYGGACLPKDLDGLLGFGSDEALDLPLLTAVREVNLSVATRTMTARLSELDEAVD
jgi:UDPglucose 6-dehydrogenase